MNEKCEQMFFSLLLRLVYF